MKAVLLIILAVLLVAGIGLYGTVKGTYNELVKLDEGVKGKWAQVENQLQRRFDLIPNLVNTVKGYAEHERGVFIDVTEARSRVGTAGNIPDKIEANNELSGAISRLLLVVENYPQLKANENFIRLQDELAGTENRIATERMRYNDSVVVLNTKLRTFPTNIIAGFFDFEKAVLFDAPEEASQAPKVEF
ncbi:MAG: LemA family protein [Gemmatimonadetes bacterium]|nr:LemA family protein [Gemmatimonadota bacterium]